MADKMNVIEAAVERIRNTNNYYEILQCNKDDPPDVIKRSYRQLALQLHPDKCSVAGCEEAFKAVNAAYSCLSDAESRAKYDRSGDDGDGYDGYSDDGFDPEDFFRMFFFSKMRRNPDMFFNFGMPPPSSFNPFDFDEDEYDFELEDPPHRRARVDWSDSGQAKNEKVNCPGCGKHMPSVDVRYSAAPFFQTRIQVCRTCNRHFEGLRGELKETQLSADSDSVVFKFPRNNKIKGKVKAAFRNDKGWRYTDRGDFTFLENKRSCLGF